jgi:hypothetical protein
MRRLIGALCVLGCEASVPEVPCATSGMVIAEPTRWRVVADDIDPFGASATRCAPEQHRVETQPSLRWHEITTNGCNTATLTQTSLARVCAGQTLELDVWHFPILYGAGEWRFALRSDAVLADAQVPLPGTPDTFRMVIELAQDVPMDAPLWLRLSNHGVNTWNIYQLRVQ